MVVASATVEYNVGYYPFVYPVFHFVVLGALNSLLCDRFFHFVIKSIYCVKRKAIIIVRVTMCSTKNHSHTEEMIMTTINITINLEQLKAEVEKSSLGSPVKASLALVLNSLMEKERDEYINALPHERSDNRNGYCNGYYDRELITGAGSLTLRVPRTRDGEFSTTVFEKYDRCEQALILSMIEMVVNGVSTRKVTKIVEALCGKSVSKSLVSNLTKSLDPIVNEWRNRPLNTIYYPYLYVDAMYIKVRENDKVVS
ncbi:hypothetical protein BACCIP111883_03342 [Sutcliffiella rhizosphaerae]|uniref:Mutator family transposase n=1 Tax=Sutcliffiella rhizosphaerae TaxID=2880967 RepID=A0ABN8AEQ1_9BACI|nr:hypothetical protein BACCIP111883_03342 [Sutcliffiella rhizosphaerae]